MPEWESPGSEGGSSKPKEEAISGSIGPKEMVHQDAIAAHVEACIVAYKAAHREDPEADADESQGEVSKILKGLFQ